MRDSGRELQQVEDSQRQGRESLFAHVETEALVELLGAARFINECADQGLIESHVLGAGSPLRRLRAAIAPFDSSPESGHRPVRQPGAASGDAGGRVTTWEAVFTESIVHAQGCPFVEGDEDGEGHVECECYVVDLWDALHKEMARG